MSIRPVQSHRRRGALVALLAAASLLGGALTLAPTSAVAMTDESNECANIPSDWQQYLCEEDKAGSSDAGSSNQDAGTTTDADAQPDAEAGKGESPGQSKGYGPPPTYTHDDFFDEVFTDEGMEKLRHSLRECDRVWRSTRRVTHIHPYRYSTWAERDPNDAEVNRELRGAWRREHCSLVYDLLAHP